MAINHKTYNVDMEKNSFNTTITNAMDTIGQNNIGSFDDNGHGTMSDFGILDSFYSQELIGITPDLVSKITESIDDYINLISSKLDNFNLDVNSAFKGEEVTKSILEFADAVNKKCNDFMEALKVINVRIIESVQKNYENLNASIASDLSSDASVVRDA